MSEIPPTGLALVLCDALYADRGGKRALIGIFNQISASHFPAVHNQMVVYASVTSMRAGTTLKLDIVNGETDQVVFQAEMSAAEEVDPTAILEISFDIKHLCFPEPATYFVRLWGNNHPLLNRPIRVIEIRSEDSDKDDDLGECPDDTGE